MAWSLFTIIVLVSLGFTSIKKTTNNRYNVPLNYVVTTSHEVTVPTEEELALQIGASEYMPLSFPCL